jgi:hypothetical protein
MQDCFVSEVARRLGVRPRDISDLFYERRLSDDRCPVVGGRRLIPADYVPTIAKVLRREGRLVDHAPAATGGTDAGPGAGPAHPTIEASR